MHMRGETRRLPVEGEEVPRPCNVSKRCSPGGAEALRVSKEAEAESHRSVPGGMPRMRTEGRGALRAWHAALNKGIHKEEEAGGRRSVQGGTHRQRTKVGRRALHWTLKWKRRRTGGPSRWPLPGRRGPRRGPGVAPPHNGVDSVAGLAKQDEWSEREHRSSGKGAAKKRERRGPLWRGGRSSTTRR